jgi:hypothetical protein
VNLLILTATSVIIMPIAIASAVSRPATRFAASMTKYQLTKLLELLILNVHAFQYTKDAVLRLNMGFWLPSKN